MSRLKKKKTKKKSSAKKRTLNISTVFAVVLVIMCFLIAIKFLSQVVTEYYDDEKIVCLDAGHGGSDAGAASTDRKRLEKNDNLRLTLAVKTQLERMGVQVVLTREDDAFTELKDRCKIANKKRCDLFVAIHRNSSAKGTGVEAWISKNEKNGEKKLAKKFLTAICEVTGQENRGVKLGYRDRSANNYYINANTNMPSILLEVGFISSEEDNRIFDEKLDETANAIAKVICESL